MVFKVKNFVYNGFYTETKPGLANYTVEFKEWTNDPGIAKCICSNGKLKLIPNFCLIGDKSMLPEQNMSNKVLFGNSSKS